MFQGSKARVGSPPGETRRQVAQAFPQERDSSIAEGMRSYQKVREGLDHELFSGSRDVEKISGLIEQKQLIRSRLAAHGVRVGP